MFRTISHWFRCRSDRNTTPTAVTASLHHIAEPVSPDNIYTQLAGQYLATDPRVVGHVSRDEQHLIFHELLAIGVDVAEDSILDVGCGVGDLFGWLGHTEPTTQYLGIDRNLNMIALAQQKYPAAAFAGLDLNQLPDGVMDWCIANSIFNLPYTDDPYTELETAIGHMWQHCEKGIAFNLLSDAEPESLREPGLFYFNAGRVFQHCQSVYGAVTIRHDYLENDFAVYIYKK